MTIIISTRDEMPAFTKISGATTQARWAVLTAGALAALTTLTTLAGGAAAATAATAAEAPASAAAEAGPGGGLQKELDKLVTKYHFPGARGTVQSKNGRVRHYTAGVADIDTKAKIP